MHKHLACRHVFLTALLGAFACASASVGAQITTPSPSSMPSAVESVVSPAAVVPPVLYRSVFVDTPTGIEKEETDWKLSNAEVGRFKRGHIDILRWEEAQSAKTLPTPPTPSATKNIAPHAHSTGVTP